MEEMTSADFSADLILCFTSLLHKDAVVFEDVSLWFRQHFHDAKSFKEVGLTHGHGIRLQTHDGKFLYLEVSA